MAKILMIGSHEETCRAVRAMLESDGCEIGTARSVEEGLAAGSRQQPEVVILDLSCAAQANTEFVKEFKAAGSDAEVIVIAEPEQRAAAVEMLKNGAAGYLLKPLQTDELRFTLTRVMEHQTMHRQLECHQGQLMQLEKLRTLSDLMGGMVHELNQPLNVTKIICQGLMRDIEKGRFSEDDVKNDLPEIIRQMNKMADMIVHLRLFTRPDEKDRREAHDMSELVREALKFITQQYKDHQIEVVDTLASGLPSVIVNRFAMEQVCFYLLSNARYAVENSSKGKMRIEVKTCLENEGKDVVLEVRDNGCGIPEEIKPKLFQPFLTTQESGKGLGLGLYRCHQIIGEHEGRIEYESRLGEGTVWRVLLPVKK